MKADTTVESESLYSSVYQDDGKIRQYMIDMFACADFHHKQHAEL